VSDSLFTTHRFEITLDKFGEDFFIPVFSDVHRYAYNCNVPGWLAFLDYCKKLQKINKNVYYLGLGDYDDLGSNSERMKLSHSELHDTTYDSLDEYMDKRTSDFSRELDFMKGRIIGLIEGNHHYKFSAGDTSTMRMCQYLKTKYLGGISIIRLVFKYKGADGGKHLALDIYAHHTAGSKGSGGRKAGASLNKLEDMADVWDVDICLAGHDHRMNSGFPVRLFLDKHMNVKQRDILLVRTGSFQKGWIPGKQGYVPTFNGKPNFLGCPILKLTPTREGVHSNHEILSVKKSVMMGDYC
jgi:hypothetical protein